MPVVSIQGENGVVSASPSRTQPVAWDKGKELWKDWVDKETEGKVEKGDPQGVTSQFANAYENKKKGIPRAGDLMTIRLLEQTHTISIPMNVITRQVTETNWSITPKEEDADESVEEAAEQEEEWLKGKLNKTDRNKFDDILKCWVKDILSIDAGVLEKVYGDADEYVEQLYPLDGMTVQKNVDEHSRLIEDEAYIQHSSPHLAAYHNMENDYLRDLYYQHLYRFRYKATEPKRFPKDKIVYTEENPSSWYEYGYGRVQIAHRLAEIVLNQDLVNRRYFSETEVPQGIMWVKGGGESDLQRVRQDVIESQKGEHHKIAVIGAPEGGEFQELRGTNKEMQFLESNEMYNKLIWATFGLSEHEVGIAADMNRATAAVQDISIYRKTTKPLLKLLEDEINEKILKDRPGYDETDGGIEFNWHYEHPELEKMEKEEQINDLQAGLKTINQVLNERGEDPVEYGDMTLNLYNQLVQTNPDWVFEHFVDSDVEPPEAPAQEPGGQLFSITPHEDEDDDEGDGNPFRKDEPMRNEREDDHPPVVGDIEELEEDLKQTIQQQVEVVYDALDDVMATKTKDFKTTLIPFDQVVGKIAIAKPLLDPLIDGISDSVQQAAEHDKAKVERELSEMTGEDVELDLDVDWKETNTFDILKDEAATRMESVEQDVQEQVRNTIQDVAEEDGDINDMTKALDDRVPEISENKARTVARTETMNASRAGSQALAESSELIAGKRWVATDDNRTRMWHSEMDGVIVEKDDEFTVPSVGDDDQPDDYPRNTYIVGGDQPFNCRCSQRSVLEEDMPSDLKSLQKKYEEVNVVG